MILKKKDDIFFTESRYEERHVPKSAGFWWDGSHWWTKIEENAIKLIDYADEETKKILIEWKEKHDETIEKSKAISIEIDYPVPESKSYYNFQKPGIEWILNRDNALIADEMGLGKTIQAIGAINADVSINHILVICPSSLRLNWKNELNKWLTRKMEITVIIGNDKEENFSKDIVIMTYGLLKKFRGEIRNFDWDLLIIDESQYVKNPKAQRTQEIFGKYKESKFAIEPISAKKKVYLTGTPILNRPIELWPILRASKVFTSWKYFVKRFCDGKHDGYGWDVSGASNLEELQEKLRSTIMLRRLKKDVLKDLPAKQRQVIEIPANGNAKVIEEERKIWDEESKKIESLKIAVEMARINDNEEAYQEAVKNLQRGILVSFTEMAKTRHRTAVVKIPVIIEHLENTSGKVVVFAHHHDVIDAIVDRFKNECVVLTGKTSLGDRQKAVDDFQNDENIRFFVGSIKAAGVGITLTASSHVVFCELDWVPANITQAEDRCHRIGQKESVLIQHIVLEGSLDSTMAKRIVEKQEIIERALDKEIIIDQSSLIPSLAGDIITEGISREEIKKEAVDINNEEIEKVHQDLKKLQSVCDCAIDKDGHGFNKIDAIFGHQLANLQSLTPRQAVAARQMLKKYKRQLSN